MLDCSTATTRPPPEMLFHSLSTNCLGDSAMEVDPPAFKAAAASSATSRQQAPPKAFLAPHAASWPMNSAPVPPQQQAPPALPMPPPGIAWVEGGCMRLCARRAADAARSVALNGGRVILEGVAMRASSCPERLQPTRCGRIYPEVRQCAAVARPGLDVFLAAPGAYFRAVCQFYRTALAS